MLERIKKLFKKNKPVENEPSTAEKIDNLFNSLKEDVIAVRVGDDLTKFGDLICDITHEVREEIKDECGFIIPEVHIQDSDSLQENEFVIIIQGKKVLNGFLIPNEQGIRDEYYNALKTQVYEYLKDIFTNEVAERYVDTAQMRNGWLIWNITRILSVSDIKTILVDIIDGGKSINNISYIFEKIGDELLGDGKWNTCCGTVYNPHKIADQVIKYL